MVKFHHLPYQNRRPWPSSKDRVLWSRAAQEKKPFFSLLRFSSLGGRQQKLAKSSAEGWAAPTHAFLQSRYALNLRISNWDV